MAHNVTLNAKIYFAAYDISGEANAHVIAHTVDLPEDLGYGDTWKQRLIGARSMNCSIAGNIDLAGADDFDTVMNDAIGVSDIPLIICPEGADVEDAAEFGTVLQSQYTPQASHGQVFKYGLTTELKNRRWTLGKVLWAPATVVTATGNGTAVQLGAVTATQYIWAAIAVIAKDPASGSSCVVALQSASDAIFTTPTTRVTFTSFDAITSEAAAPVAGAITDTYWRMIVSTFAGTSMQFIGVAGIAGAASVAS